MIITAVVAIVLALMSNGLKPIHDKNEAIYNKKAILSAIADHLGKDLGSLSDDEIIEIFNNQISQTVIDMDGKVVDEQTMVSLGYKDGSAESVDMGKEMKKSEADRLLPLYTYKKADGEDFYVVNVRGKGLWDEIWGCIALEKDLNTIAGVAFDHKAETPGLGAEIKDNIAWKNQFTGKKLFTNDGEFKSVYVRKGGAKDPVYEVDGISGATITADGVTEMLARGIKYYQPYLNTIKQ